MVQIDHRPINRVLLTSVLPDEQWRDFLVDSPLSRERSNFFDLQHMRENVARAMEPQIVSALNGAR